MKDKDSERKPWMLRLMAHDSAYYSAERIKRNLESGWYDDDPRDPPSKPIWWRQFWPFDRRSV